ncbi:uncharacterized protein BdWA1_003556 [Babesia duncani]|nr:hypothetical protein BdWA1_003556 [Babesia duncani]
MYFIIPKKKLLLRSHEALSLRGYIFHRHFASVPPIHHLPPPPPPEFNEDGTPKKYRNSKRVYNHKYNWEHWTLRPAGVFHTVLVGEFGRQHKAFVAWLLQYPAHVAAIPSIIIVFVLAFLIQTLPLVGVKPKRYTIEWIQAQKERELAENTNPISRYLDRRRSVSIKCIMGH